MRHGKARRAGSIGAIIAALLLSGTASSRAKPERLTTAEFRELMATVAEGWNEGNARKAADCFAPNATYSEPPRQQFYEGREALFEFFGGHGKRSMSMTWHHLVFDEQSQVGAGEYTFRGNSQSHGVTMVKIEGGLIRNWREYQYRSALPWDEFVDDNAF